MSSGRAASVALGAIASVLTARLLGPTGRGELALLLFIGMLGGRVVSGGLHNWAQKTIPACGDDRSVTDVLSVHVVVVVVVVSATALAVTPMLGSSDSTALAVYLVAATWSALGLGVVLGHRRMRRHAAASVAGSATFTMLLVVLLLSGGRVQPSTVLLASAGGSCAAAVVSRWRPRRPPIRVAGRAYGRALAFGVHIVVGELVFLALTRLDLVAVEFWGDTKEVGYYAVALSVAQVIWVVPAAAAQVVLTHVAQHPDRADTAGMVRMVTAVVLACAVLASVAAPVVVPFVFGEDFASAVAAIPGLAVSIAALGAWSLLCYDFVARGQPRPFIGTGIVGTAAMLGADALLVPAHGVLGASIGALIGYTVAAVVMSVLWVRAGRGRARELVGLHRSDLGAAKQLIGRVRGR